jgi:hypothetical protein
MQRQNLRMVLLMGNFLSTRNRFLGLNREFIKSHDSLGSKTFFTAETQRARRQKTLKPASAVFLCDLCALYGESIFPLATGAVPPESYHNHMQK